jgi:hypothetical protein
MKTTRSPKLRFELDLHGTKFFFWHRFIELLSSDELLWRFVTCLCQTSWEPVLPNLFSEFPVVADGAELGGRKLYPNVCCTCGYWYCVGLLRWGELWEERPPRGSLGRSPSCCPFTRLQPLYVPEWGFSPSARSLVQQLRVDSLSGPSWYPYANGRRCTTNI